MVGDEVWEKEANKVDNDDDDDDDESNNHVDSQPVALFFLLSCAILFHKAYSYATWNLNHSTLDKHNTCLR